MWLGNYENGEGVSTKTSEADQGEADVVHLTDHAQNELFVAFKAGVHLHFLAKLPQCQVDRIMHLKS